MLYVRGKRLKPTTIGSERNVHGGCVDGTTSADAVAAVASAAAVDDDDDDCLLYTSPSPRDS